MLTSGFGLTFGQDLTIVYIRDSFPLVDLAISIGFSLVIRIRILLVQNPHLFGYSLLYDEDYAVRTPLPDHPPSLGRRFRS